MLFVARFRVRAAAPSRRGAAGRAARGARAVVAWPRARVRRRARALVSNAGASRSSTRTADHQTCARAAARGRARVEHGAAAAGLHEAVRAPFIARERGRCELAPRAFLQSWGTRGARDQSYGRLVQ